MAIGFAAADYKDMEGFMEELEDALRAIGVYMYQDPIVAGSDMYGYVFSNEEMPVEEIRVKAEEYWNLDNEEVWGEGANEMNEPIEEPEVY